MPSTLERAEFESYIQLGITDVKLAQYWHKIGVIQKWIKHHIWKWVAEAFVRLPFVLGFLMSGQSDTLYVNFISGKS